MLYNTLWFWYIIVLQNIGCCYHHCCRYFIDDPIEAQISDITNLFKITQPETAWDGIWTQASLTL